MGFLDDVQASVNRGIDGASRGVETMKLNGQMGDALGRREKLAAELGASLYKVTKDDAALREGREELYDGIAAIDAECAEIQAKLDEIEREAAEAARAAAGIDCPFCHTHMEAADRFCSGCGKPRVEVEAAIAEAAQASARDDGSADGAESPVAPVCPACGFAVNEGDLFCMSCGSKLGE